MSFRTMGELEAGLQDILASPTDGGTLQMIVRRPAEDDREVLEVAELSLAEGVVGDMWIRKGSMRTEDGSAHPDMQLAAINARFLDLIAGSRDRWPLAGDQLVLDMDISHDNLPTGTGLRIGDAILEVTDQLHTGCQKFVARYGAEALRMTATDAGRSLRLRGVYLRVVAPGTVRPGDTVTKTS